MSLSSFLLAIGGGLLGSLLYYGVADVVRGLFDCYLPERRAARREGRPPYWVSERGSGACGPQRLVTDALLRFARRGATLPSSGGTRLARGRHVHHLT